jgi:drug/metabolite transporter (DMT)-like permease
VVSMLCGFWAIAHLPLAQAVSLSYSTPLFVTVLAVWLLGEQVRARRWLAVVAGFIGVLIIVRPGTSGFTVHSLIAITAAVMSGIVSIQIKQLSALEPADRIVLWTTMLWVPMSLVPALAVWEWPRGITWVWVAAAGLLGTGGHMLWTRALKLGDVSALTPISFMQLPVVAVAGWFMFDEPLDRYTLLGALVIFGANAYIAHREATLARRDATAAPVEAAKPGE